MFNFILNQKCNWSCSYCGVSNKDKSTTIEILKTHLPYIKDIYNKISYLFDMKLMIQGGEIGFIDTDVLEYLFKYWGEEIYVSTNGELFNIKSKIIHDNINEYLFHISPDTNTDIKEYPKLKKNNIGICCDSKDPIKIRNYIKKYDDIYFNFVDYESDVNKPCISEDFDDQSLYDNIKDLENVSDYAKERILNRINNTTKLSTSRDICSSLNHVVMIDFVNERIVQCTRNFDKAFIPLTKENLIKTLTETDVFTGMDNNCESCYRMCHDINLSKVFDLKKKYKEILIKN
jgi:hypothetical protein